MLKYSADKQFLSQHLLSSLSFQSTLPNPIPLYSPPMNVSASFNVFRLIINPALCLPHATIPTFNHIPIPLEKAFAVGEQGQKHNIRAIVLDKDNCFARPKENVVWGEYEVSNVHVFGAFHSQHTQENLDYVCCVAVIVRYHVFPHTRGLNGKNPTVRVSGLCPGGVSGCHATPIHPLPTSPLRSRRGAYESVPLVTYSRPLVSTLFVLSLGIILILDEPE